MFLKDELQKHLMHVAFGLVLIVACVVPAEACTCHRPGTAEMYEYADVVFTARIDDEVLAFTSRNETLLHGFAVLEKFKGEITFNKLPSTNDSCSITYEPGAEYLIFAKSDGKAGACGGTRRIYSEDRSPSRGELMVRALREFKAGSEIMVPGWVTYSTKLICLLEGEISPGGSFHLSYRPRNAKSAEKFHLKFNRPLVGRPLHSSDPYARQDVTLDIGDLSLTFVASSHGGGASKEVDKTQFYKLFNTLEKINSADDAVAVVKSRNNKTVANFSVNVGGEENAFKKFSMCMDKFEKN